jgi:hypothetical protein
MKQDADKLQRMPLTNSPTPSDFAKAIGTVAIIYTTYFIGIKVYRRIVQSLQDILDQ